MCIARLGQDNVSTPLSLNRVDSSTQNMVYQKGAGNQLQGIPVPPLTAHPGRYSSRESWKPLDKPSTTSSIYALAKATDASAGTSNCHIAP